MSESIDNEKAVADDSKPGRYEPPKLTHLGNARELLAGAAGSITDVLPSPLMPSQSSGG
jgi:hypothetical protein